MTTSVYQLNGALHPQWKGEEVGYNRLHAWIRKQLRLPRFCEHCGDEKPLDLANKSQLYKRDLYDWEYLCRSCHMKADGRLKQLQTNHLAKFPTNFCPSGHKAVTKTGLCMKMYNCQRRHSSCEACQ